MRLFSLIAGLCCLTVVANPVVAEPPLTITPAEITLYGPRAHQQLAVTLDPGPGQIRDVSTEVVLSSVDPQIAEVVDGLVVPRANGTTTVRAEHGQLTAEVTVTVSRIEQPDPVAFHTEVLAGLTKAGCNMGACHGSPSGKGGFRLSLRGYDPELDLLTLRGEFFNRRSNLLAPDDSLLLQKPLMQLAHGGGRRLTEGDPIHAVLRGWIAAGMQLEPPETPTLERIEVLPKARVLWDGADRQQLVVNGYFSDGTVRDVTALTAFDSSDDGIARATPDGVVHREGRGEAAVLARYLDRMSTSQITFLTNRPAFSWPNPPEHNQIDRLVFAKLKQLQILPSQLCSDAEFVRRATLDLVGRLPTLEEIQRFDQDGPDVRRQQLVDRLLDTEDYADFWAMKWADVLRCNSRRMTASGVHKFRRWLYDAVRSDLPLSDFTVALLTATGSTHTNPAASYWRASQDEADATETTAQLFLGIRIQCAKCHNHPFEKWTQDDYYGISAAFKRVGRKDGTLPNEQLIYVTGSGDVTQPRTGQVMKTRLLLQGDVDVPADQDRRAVFAQWLTDAENPFFARSLANRIWGHVMGRGVVEPVDDFRDSNPPSNPELLDYLEQQLVQSNYSAKSLIRTIMASRTYQLSASRNEFNQDDEICFSHATTRMLTAEQLLDSICQVSGVPEEFKNMPPGSRAIELVDPPSDHQFLQVFGQPARELPCECERSTDSNLSQALQLINGPTVHNKLRSQQGRIHRWIADGTSDEVAVRKLYLLALSREPQAAELQTSLAHLQQAADRATALEDVAWALINSKEFLFQH